MLIVLDTNVLVAGLCSNQGASFQILSLIPYQKFEFLLSVPLFFEYESVLKREEHLLEYNLTLDDIDILLAMWANKGKAVDMYYLWRPQLSDPNDEMVLETAINGNADAIVTFNKKHFSNSASNFGVKLLSPAEFYLKIRGI